MHPAIQVDLDVLAANALAWANFAGVSVRAVLKGDGYGWGIDRLADVLNDRVSGYCVSDAEEFFALRARTELPIAILGRLERAAIAAVLETGGLPTLADQGDLEAATAWGRSKNCAPRVRIGVLPAAGWTGFDLDELHGFAPALAASGAQVEVWTHFTDLETIGEDAIRFRDAVSMAMAAGVRVVATDSASTFPLARAGAGGDSVRIGIGLFGATGGPAVPGVHCALRVHAPITDVREYQAGARVGYGGELERGGAITTARCGYADGLPRTFAGGDVLAVGMQYITLRGVHARAENSQVVLLDRQSSLDAFAERCGRLPHEVVTAFGNAARERRSS